MSQFIRDYGLIFILIAGALGGYFWLGEEREDILASSLDSIGHRLNDLVVGTEAKAQTANDFNAFKEAVASNEIAPEDVERIAANVLNLSASGAALSQEDVELVLDMSVEGGVNTLPMPQVLAEETAPAMSDEAPVSTSSETPIRTWSDESSRQVGSRLAAMVEFADRMTELSEKEAMKMNEHVQFVVNEGLQVIVDTVLSSKWQEPEMRKVTRDLERDKRFIWNRDLENARRQQAEYYGSQKQMIDRAKRSPGMMPPDEMEAFRVVEQINRLQELGVILRDSSKVRVRLERILSDALGKLEIELDSTARQGTVRVDGSSK